MLLALISGQALARNVVFIAIDDMRVDPQALTPNIDALAAQGTRYSRAYTTAAWCLPARTSVMFGLSPRTHGVGLSLGFEGYDALYNSSMKTLPEVFKDAGYTTASVGKVFHTPEPSRWDVNGPAINWAEEYADLYAPGPYFTFMHSGPVAGTHPDQDVADWAVDFINNQTGPFFLAVGFFQPHLPWIAPQWAYDLYPSPSVYIPPANDMNDEPPIAREWANHPVLLGATTYNIIHAAGLAQEYTRGYLAAISHTDAMVGQVLAAIDFDTTDVILWSDNGFHLGEKFHWHKQTLWEQTIRVPLVIRAAAITPGVDTRAVSLLDIAPTVLEIAGLPPFAQFEGASLATGASPVESFYQDAVATINNGGMKRIDYATSTARYNLNTDPMELVNIPPGC